VGHVARVVSVVDLTGSAARDESPRTREFVDIACVRAEPPATEPVEWEKLRLNLLIR
jgi:hypothetical protein